MNKFRITLALAAAAALFAFSTTAQAGSYRVTQCDAATASQMVGWTSFTAGSWSAKGSCPAGITLRSSGVGRYASYRTPALPAELGVTRVSFLATGLRTKSARPEAGFCVNAPVKGACKRQNSRRAAKHTERPHTVEYVWHGKASGAKGFELAVRGTSSKASSSKAYLNARNFKFTVTDSQAPTINVDASSVPTSVASQPFTIAVSGTDGGGGVTNFAYTAVGASDSQVTRSLSLSCSYTTFRPCPAAGSRAFTINPADFETGLNALTFTSEDAAGNKSAPVTINFTAGRVSAASDITAPTLDVGSSSIPTTWTRGAFSVPVSAEDSESGVAAIVVDASGPAPSRRINVDCSGGCPSSFSDAFSVNTTDFATGPVSLTFRSVDAAGNVSDPQSFAVEVDNVAPAKPGPIAYTGGDCSPADVRWQYDGADDAGSPITHVRLAYAELSQDWDPSIFEWVSNAAETVTTDIPLGVTSTYGTVTPSGITRVRLPSSSGDTNYVVLIQLVDAAGNVSAVRGAFVNSDPCDS